MTGILVIARARAELASLAQDLAAAQRQLGRDNGAISVGRAASYALTAAHLLDLAIAAGAEAVEIAQ